MILLRKFNRENSQNYPCFPFSSGALKCKYKSFFLTLLHSEQPKLYGVLAVLSAIGLTQIFGTFFTVQSKSKNSQTNWESYIFTFKKVICNAYEKKKKKKSLGCKLNFYANLHASHLMNFFGSSHIGKFQVYITCSCLYAWSRKLIKCSLLLLTDGGARDKLECCS